MQGRKPGGIWRVGSLGLLAVGRERSPPEGAYDLNPQFQSIPLDAPPPLPPRAAAPPPLPARPAALPVAFAQPLGKSTAF